VSIEKYLSRYADPRALSAPWPSGEYAAAVVIPARNELEALPLAIRRIAEVAPDALSIVVLNARVDDEAAIFAANAATAEELAAYPHVHLIDASSEGARLAPKEGVGHARKIGADYALRLVHAGIVQSHTLYFTDADAYVPQDYIPRGGLDEGDAGCALFPFVHTGESEPESTACAIYEASLRLYALGLHHARSPYAFCTLGSTITTRAETYAQVRGMPQRGAGEDFHYLDKAVRIAPVVRLGGTPMSLSSRASRRVPFGTGPSVFGLVASGLHAQRSLNPALYDLLRTLSAAIDAWSAGEDGEPQLAPPVRLALHAAGWSASLELAARAKASAPQRRRRLYETMSALRTRRLLHQLRDSRDDGEQTTFDAAASARFLSEPARLAAQSQDPIALCEALRAQCARTLIGPVGPTLSLVPSKPFVVKA